MAVNPVNARINVMVAGQNLLNSLSASYRAVASAAGQATTAVRNWNTVQRTQAQSVGNMFSGMGRLTQALAGYNAQMNAGHRQTTAFGGSIVNLTKSMVLFSVLLPLVRLPQTAIQSVQDFVKVGTEWEHQIRSINSLLGLSDDQYKVFDTRVRNLAETYALTTDEIGTAGKAIASTLGIIQRNTEGMTAAQKSQDDMNTSMILMEKIARLSRASFEDMNTVQEASFTIMAAGRLTLEQADDAFNVLFGTVKAGRSTFQQFNTDAAKFLPMATEWIEAVGTGADKTQERFSRLTGVMDAFVAASQGIGSERAATGLGRIFQATAGASAQQQKFIAQIEQMRKKQGLGEEYNITPGALYAAGDVGTVFSRLENVLGPQSPVITQAIDKMRKKGTLGDETAQRAAFSQQLQMKYLEQREAVRAFTEITAPGRLQSATAERAGNAGGVEQGMEQYMKDPKSAMDRMQASWDRIKVGIFDSLRDSVVRVTMGLAQVFQTINQGIEQGIGGKDFVSRIKYVADSLIKAFTNYYNGGGKAEIKNLGYTIGANTALFLTDFFSGEGKNAVVDAAKSFSEAFVYGIKDNLPGLLGVALKSALIQAVASFAILKMTGLPAPLAAIGAVASTAGLQGGLGAGGAAASVGGLALASGVAGLILRNRLVNSRAAGVLGGPVANAARTGPGAIMRGLGGRGGIATALLGGGVQALMASQEQDERTKWSGFGGAAGSVLGALGGGLLGTVPAVASLGLGAPLIAALGIGGSMAGSAAGGAVGGGLYDLFHQRQRAMVSAGAGGAPATEEDMRLAQVFAMGIDSSDMITWLEQISRKLDIPGPLGTGVGKKSPTAAAGIPGSAGGASLEAAFTKQSAAPLTKSQADAACGPAAVAFFAKVYGRTPTLMEAYTLVSQTQGIDVAALGGTRNVGVVGQALTSMGVPNEAVAGANIDWGRMAENAKAGRPSVLNVGPNGAFPGHFFQIGGWNPDNNTFNVGPNGIKGMPQWMSPSQFQSLGPLLGAVYGTANPTKAAAGAGGNIMAANAGAAAAIQAATGIPASYLLAVAANENGMQGSQLSNVYNNFGGIKAAGATGIPGYSGSVNMPTWESVNGQRVNTTADFATFSDPQSGLMASAQFLMNNPRYAAAVNYVKNGGDPGTFAKMVHQAGYATDPNWSNQINKLQGQASQYLGGSSGAGQSSGATIQVDNLIGTVNLGGAATQDDADALAAMLANALEEVVSAHGGGSIGQVRLVGS